MTKKEVQHLADLARIQITDKESESLRTECEDVLSYVDAIQDIATDAPLEKQVGLHQHSVA